MNISERLSANQLALYTHANHFLTEHNTDISKHKHKQKKNAYAYAFVAAVLTNAKASFAYASVASEDWALIFAKSS